jgi:hypothetical protein
MQQYVGRVAQVRERGQRANLGSSEVGAFGPVPPFGFAQGRLMPKPGKHGAPQIETGFSFSGLYFPRKVGRPPPSGEMFHVEHIVMTARAIQYCRDI